MTVGWLDQLGPPDADDVRRLADSAADADGMAPLSDAARLRLGHPHPGAHHLLLHADGRLVGYAAAQLHPPEAEVVVAPGDRGHGYGRQLITQLLTRVPGPLRVWAHGDSPAAQRLAAELGFRPERTLWQLRRPLAAPRPLPPPPPPPPGVVVRTFRVGHDESAWLAVNARAFADHPEQGQWQADDLREREHEDWFDPAGFFVAEHAGAIVGFHWTKVHPARGTTPPVGEVYVIGVDPSMQGSGLGRLLLGVGLEHLREAGLATVILYVDGDNHRAIRMYEQVGFRRARADVQYRRHEVPG